MYKMLAVLETLEEVGVSLHGDIYASSNGELYLELCGQPDQEIVFRYLNRKGFVETTPGRFVYRP